LSQSSPVSVDHLSVTVIVPTRNESGNIGPLIDALLALPGYGGRLEVIVADDASGDGTIDEVQARADQSDRVRLLSRTGPADLTAAVLEAAQTARAELCVVMDADGSHPVDAIPRLLRPIQAGEADVVVGSRHVPGGSIPDWPRRRRLVSRAAALLAWPFAAIRDPMSGFFAVRRARITQLEPIEAGYKVLLEVLVRTRPEPRVKEIPIEFNDRDTGASKMNARVQWLFVRRLAALGGARLTLRNLSRFSVVGLSGLVLDLALFWLLQGLGVGLATAHLLAFLGATLNNYLLNARWSFAGQFVNGRSALVRYGAFLVVALLALTLRGGVLAALTGGLGVPAELAILPAVALTAAINYLGSIFYVFPAVEAEHNPDTRWRMAAIALIGCSLALRWMYMGQAELIFDEMYYWVYTLHPALSYLDHPPLTAWLIAATTGLFGDNAFGVRAPTLLLGPASIVFAYLLARDMYDKTRGLIAAMLIAVVPGWLASGLLMTTDAIVVPAWLATLYFLRRALIDNHAPSWYGVGLALGIGLLGKYTIALLGPATLTFLLVHPPARRRLCSPHPWLAMLVALALFSPVLIWNARHDWASFAFQSIRRINESPDFTSHLLPLQTLAMLAPLAGLVAFCLLTPLARRLCPDTTECRFAWAMTVTPLLLLSLFGLGTEIRYHWVVPIWLGVLPLIAASVYPPQASAGQKLLKGLARLWKPVLPLSLVITGVGLHYISLGLPGIGWEPNRMGYMGWPEIAEQVHKLEAEIETQTGRRPIIAGMAKWGIPAALTFHDHDRRVDNITARNLVGMSGSQWEWWFDPGTDPDRPVLLVSHESKLIDEEWLTRALVGLGPLRQVQVERSGQPIQNLYYRIGDGFRPELLRYPGHIPK